MTLNRVRAGAAAAVLLALGLAAGAEERVLTGKERLGGKASDPQRVDDCKVPAALRDPAVPRPADCARQRGRSPAAKAKGVAR
ncbi:MAG: hypothetical protein AAF074_23260 [Pseudomonadota bacterium]